MSVPLENSHGPWEPFRSKRGAEDVEAGDFDENELDDLKTKRTANGSAVQLDDEHHSLGGDREEGADDGRSRKRQDTVTGLERR